MAATAFVIPFGLFFPMQQFGSFYGQWGNLFIWFAVGFALSQVQKPTKTPQRYLQGKLLKFDNYKKKTFTSYWNNFSEQPKKLIKSKNFLKSLRLKIIKILGFKVSIRINKNKPHKDEAYISYPIDKIVIN